MNSHIRADDRDQGVIIGIESALTYGRISSGVRSENLSPEQWALKSVGMMVNLIEKKKT